MTYDIGGHEMQDRLELIELLLALTPEERRDVISRFEAWRRTYREGLGLPHQTKT